MITHAAVMLRPGACKWSAASTTRDIFWQLVINTGATIVTFLLVFLIQNSQNRDNAAIGQVKLDELIRVSTAHNSFVGIEHLTDEELDANSAPEASSAPKPRKSAKKRLKSAATKAKPGRRSGD